MSEHRTFNERLAAGEMVFVSNVPREGAYFDDSYDEIIRNHIEKYGEENVIIGDAYNAQDGNARHSDLQLGLYVVATALEKQNS